MADREQDSAGVADAATPTVSLDGWVIGTFADIGWAPWGDGKARAKVLGAADGYLVTVVQADAGYEGTPHQHGSAEFFYLIDGEVRNQGRTMHKGDGYRLGRAPSMPISRPIRALVTSSSSSCSGR